MTAFENNIRNALSFFGLESDHSQVSILSSGLIHVTWRVNCLGNLYILQQMNTNVFGDPSAVTENIMMIHNYLQSINSNLLFTPPLVGLDGKLIFTFETMSYRMFNFVPNSLSFGTLVSSKQAFEASSQFARLTKQLLSFNHSNLHIPIPNFHNLNIRYDSFDHAIIHGITERITMCSNEIQYLQSLHSIVDTYTDMLYDDQFVIRVMHHDTKISNVLFDAMDGNTSLGVIDYDTMMPGLFISDVGDMIRTYVSPVDENEADCTKILVRDEYFHAIVDGYLSELGDELTMNEKNSFIFAGKFMIYMQAIRFLTDFLCGDTYYQLSLREQSHDNLYRNKNYLRSKNQIVLLQELIKKEPALRERDLLQ